MQQRAPVLQPEIGARRPGRFLRQPMAEDLDIDKGLRRLHEVLRPLVFEHQRRFRPSGAQRQFEGVIDCGRGHQRAIR